MIASYTVVSHDTSFESRSVDDQRSIPSEKRTDKLTLSLDAWKMPVCDAKMATIHGRLPGIMNEIDRRQSSIRSIVTDDAEGSIGDFTHVRAHYLTATCPYCGAQEQLEHGRWRVYLAGECKVAHVIDDECGSEPQGASRCYADHPRDWTAPCELLALRRNIERKANPLDIYRFMNSKDVADHLRETGYELDAMEAAYFVEICDDATLSEKIEAWRWIVATMPDCPMAHNHDIGECDSIHAFLLDYIDLQQRMLDIFEQGEGSVYFLRKARYRKWPEWLAGKRDDLWVDDYPRPFSTLAKCTDFLKREQADDDEFDRYVISKEKVDAVCEIGNSRQSEIVLDAAFRPMSVSVSGLDESDRDMTWHLSDSFLKFPVPFKRGDVVIDRTSPRPHPFVFDYLKFWNSSELAASGRPPLPAAETEKVDRRVARADERCSWDVSHMVACGYELGEHYAGGPLSDPCDLCFDVFGACGNYLNLERYTEPLEGNLRILRIASEFMKGDIGISCAINFARAVSLDHHASELKRAYDSEYYKIGHLYGGESE